MGHEKFEYEKQMGAKQRLVTKKMERKNWLRKKIGYTKKFGHENKFGYEKNRVPTKLGTQNIWVQKMWVRRKNGYKKWIRKKNWVRK